MRARRANLRDARRKVPFCFVGRYSPAQSCVARPNAPQKHVWRAEIVLLTADGVGTNEIMRRTAKSKTCVWRWQERFLEDGFDGLLRDKTRPSQIKPLRAEATERVVALTLGDPPGETTHWTGALMAKAAGLSVSSVHQSDAGTKC